MRQKSPGHEAFHRPRDECSGALALAPAVQSLSVAPASLERNRRAAIENIIDNDPVAAVVREIMADRAQWRGSASDLLQIGVNSAWPKSARHSRLRGAETFLRTLGIEIVFGREGRLRTRTIRITAW